MKKLFFNSIYFLIVFCLFGFIIDVKAAVYQCEYKFGDTDGLNHTFEYDTEKGKFKITDIRTNNTSGLNSYIYTYNVDLKTTEIQALDDKQCPVLHLVVKDSYFSSTVGAFTYNTYSYEYNFFSDSNRMVEKLGSNVKSFEGTAADSETNNENQFVSTCPTLDVLFDEIKKSYEAYDACEGAKCAKELGEAKSNVEKMKTACKDILSNRDVIIGNELDEDDEPTKDKCIDECLNVDTRIEELKDSLGIAEPETGECGLSARLISWGLNIMKWVKYILPVIVIILGFFDFIKATAEEKEDEMKKAQKKFITRLIAAALVFIIPFIIEFVIDKFGFEEYTDGCGVIQEIE